MPTRPQLTATRRKRVLELVAKGLTDTEAAAAVGVSRYVIARAKKGDPGFAEAYAEAYEAGLDPMLQEARSRAIDGTPKLIVDKDGNEHWDTVKSDPLLMFLIKQRDPSFRENHRVEIDARSRVEVHVDHDFGAIAGVLEGVGLLPPGARQVLDAAPLAVLPARADGEADGGPGSPPAPPS